VRHEDQEQDVLQEQVDVVQALVHLRAEGPQVYVVRVDVGYAPLGAVHVVCR
jgi:hypothetical protein